MFIQPCGLIQIVRRQAGSSFYISLKREAEGTTRRIGTPPRMKKTITALNPLDLAGGDEDAGQG